MENSATKVSRQKCPDFIRFTLDIYISNRNGWLPCGRLPWKMNRQHKPGLHVSRSEF